MKLRRTKKNCAIFVPFMHCP